MNLILKLSIAFSLSLFMIKTSTGLDPKSGEEKDTKPGEKGALFSFHSSTYYMPNPMPPKCPKLAHYLPVNQRPIHST